MQTVQPQYEEVNQNLAAQCAQWYLSQGIQPVRMAVGEKGPREKDWQKTLYRTDQISTAFAGQVNIGLLLGEPSGNLVCVDADSPQAVLLAPYFLPLTQMVCGRPGKPSAGWFYRSAVKTTRYTDPRKIIDPATGKPKMERVVELLSTGAQKVVYPSIHPTGEQYAWSHPLDIPNVALIDPAELLTRVGWLAAAALLAKYWPGEGIRNEYALALSGAMLRGRVPADIAECVVRCAAWAAGDSGELDKRAKCVGDTAAKLQAGEAVTGLPAAAKLVGGDVVGKALEWLGAVGTPTVGADGKPIILLTPGEYQAVGQAVAALASSPIVYRRGGKLVRIVRDGKATKDRQIHRPPEAPQITTLPKPTLRTILSEVVTFETLKELKDGTLKRTVAHPTAWLVDAVDAAAEWPGIPHLEGITESPVLRSNGTILNEPGYDEITGLIYEPAPGLDVQIPAAPTPQDVAQARDLLLDIVCDFPFEKEAHRAAFLAAVLTPLARPAYSGPSPLFLISGNTPGVGKGLLADVVGDIATGRELCRMLYSHDDAEVRKCILSLGLAGDPIVLLDNVSGVLGTPALDAALTAEFVKDRLLSTNEMPRVPARMVWLATGNNVELAGDTPRRTLHIRIETPLEKPEERGGFKYHPLRDHVRANRGKLLSAALTILRGFCAAGRPDFGLTLWGSYEGWCRIVRDAVVFAGMPDPCLTRQAVAGADRSITERLLTGLWEITTWMQQMGEGRPISAGEIIRLIDNYPGHFHTMRDAIVELSGNGKPNSRSLGWALTKARTRVIGGWMIDSTERSGTKVYFVRQPSP